MSLITSFLILNSLMARLLTWISLLNLSLEIRANSIRCRPIRMYSYFDAEHVIN